MIIVFGGKGYVGRAFCQALERDGVPFHSVSRQTVDYYQSAELGGMIKQLQPTFLINAVGYTGKPNVVAYEVHRHACLLCNAVLSGVVREVCEPQNLPWGHLSSGCICSGDGPGNQGFSEDDTPNFSFGSNYCSFYWGTKALGEEALGSAKDCYIWRLRIPFDQLDGPRNYLSKLMRYERLLDVRNSVSHLGNFVYACLESERRRVPFGVYNVTNSGSVTTRQVVRIIKQYRFQDRSFAYFENEEDFMQLVAKAPCSSCVLNNGKLLEHGVPMPSVEDALHRALKEWCAA